MRNPPRTLALAFIVCLAAAPVSAATEAPNLISDQCSGNDANGLKRALAEYCASTPSRKGRARRGCRVLEHQLRTCASLYVDDGQRAADIWADEPGHGEYMWHAAFARIGKEWKVILLQREEDYGC